MTQGTDITRVEQIEHCIFLMRGQKVMLDFHLAALYGVETKNLNKAVRRNQDRFPADFMFHLTAGEFANLKFQFGTSSSTHGGRRKPVSAFTEQGVAMLSSMLRSERAIHVNVAISRPPHPGLLSPPGEKVSGGRLRGCLRLRTCPAGRLF